MAAVAMFGLSRLGATASPNDTITWFVLLGLGLSPVMVGATNVIVGNAPVELARMAGGGQSTAMQLGGAFGTAISAPSCPPGSTACSPPAGTPRTCPRYERPDAQQKSAVSVGAAPGHAGTPPQRAGVIAHISHATFTAGMHDAFLVAAAVALVGALTALIAKRGNDTAAAHAVI